MSSVEIKCALFEAECGECLSRFAYPVFNGGYGQFLLRSKGTSEMAYLDALNDETFSDVRGMVNDLLASITRSEREVVNIFHDIVGSVYDNDTQGFSFSITAPPECPVCKAHKSVSFHSLEPPRYQQITVPTVSASRWRLLTKEEKVASVRTLLMHCDLKAV